jgi:hypothetical protein
MRIAVLLLVAVGLVAAACSSGEKGERPTTAPPEAVLWLYQNAIPFATSNPEAASRTSSR